MSHFLSHLHAELRRVRLTRKGATHRPDDVPRFLHKKYPRMDQIQLPEPRHVDISLANAILKRRSASSGNSDALLSLEECGTLFGIALRAHLDARLRGYPSGGALYPIETYLISTALEKFSPSVFHYNPTAHVLEKLWDMPPDMKMNDVVHNDPEVPFSSLIVFTSVWSRSSAKYGDLAYLHALLEAGHMSQNTLLVGSALGLLMRPMAGFDDARISSLLDLDESEQAVHSITLCKSTPKRASSTSLDIFG